MAKDYVEERNGTYYVAGTRVSLDSIVHAFREGKSPESILAEFDTLTLAQIYGAIAHYLDHQPAIDAYYVRQRQRAQALRSAAEPLPAELRERLEAAKQRLRSGD